MQRNNIYFKLLITLVSSSVVGCLGSNYNSQSDQVNLNHKDGHDMGTTTCDKLRTGSSPDDFINTGKMVIKEGSLPNSSGLKLRTNKTFNNDYSISNYSSRRRFNYNEVGIDHTEQTSNKYVDPKDSQNKVMSNDGLMKNVTSTSINIEEEASIAMISHDSTLNSSQEQISNNSISSNSNSDLLPDQEEGKDQAISQDTLMEDEVTSHTTRKKTTVEMESHDSILESTDDVLIINSKEEMHELLIDLNKESFNAKFGRTEKDIKILDMTYCMDCKFIFNRVNDEDFIKFKYLLLKLSAVNKIYIEDGFSENIGYKICIGRCIKVMQRPFPLTSKEKITGEGFYTDNETLIITSKEGGMNLINLALASFKDDNQLLDKTGLSSEDIFVIDITALSEEDGNELMFEENFMGSLLTKLKIHTVINRTFDKVYPSTTIGLPIQFITELKLSTRSLGAGKKRYAIIPMSETNSNAEIVIRHDAYK